jgi:Zn-dependent protease
MSRTFTFGKISGIPLRVQFNWTITAVLVTWSLAGGFFPQAFPNREPGFYWFFGSLTALLFFASVLLHEIGHAVIAIREKVPVKSITLFVFGGVAHIGREPSTPSSEFRIVAAGPLTSLLLAFGFQVAGMILVGVPVLSKVNFYLAQINLILALFNLIPGFPLDGGRLLRSILWAIKGNFHTATKWAANTGLVLACLSIGVGLVMMMFGMVLNGLWIIFIGWYLSHMARESYKQSIQYAPWRTIVHKIQPERVASISLRNQLPDYRAAVVRVEVVNHGMLMGLPQTGTLSDDPGD